MLFHRTSTQLTVTQTNKSDVSFRVIIINMLMKSMNRLGISKNVNYRNESNAKTENYQFQNKESNGQKIN